MRQPPFLLSSLLSVLLLVVAGQLDTRIMPGTKLVPCMPRHTRVAAGVRLACNNPPHSPNFALAPLHTVHEICVNTLHSPSPHIYFVLIHPQYAVEDPGAQGAGLGTNF